MGKPKDWDKLDAERKREIGLSLFHSIRGRFIMSQALSKAIDTMKKVKPYPETSNIEDMEILHETLFPIYRKEIMELTPKQIEKMMKAKSKKKSKEVV